MKHIFKLILIFITLLSCFFAFSQSTTSTNVAGTSTEFLGWDGTGSNSKDVDVTNRFGNRNINFSTNNGTSTTQKMVIVGSSGTDDGNVGIGITSPSERLQVVGGNIDLNTGTNAYMINNEIILWNNGDNSNIYVGFGAGIADNGVDNVFVGKSSGISNNSGLGNTFVGSTAGIDNTTGQHNVFIGSAAGPDNTTGYQNVFIGSIAGDGNTTGNNNTCVGEWTALGSGNLDNATAIGAFAMAAQSNTIVLGSINGVNGATASTSVGIGTTTPASVLHLNRNAAVPVVTQYTNPNALSVTGTGFQVGINGAGTGIIQHPVAGRFIDVSTVGHLPLASFTTDNFFGSAGPPLNTQGDGVRIYDPFGGTGNLDLWTSTSNQTHIVWGPNGRIQGINNRFEIQCDFTDGLWFNVTDPTTGTFFNAQGVENGRIGANTFWRIGANPGNVDALNTLEIDQGTPGFSGLRFTQLMSGSMPDPANGLALSVDPDGDVILVPSNTGDVTGCGSPNVNYVTKWTSVSPKTVCNSLIYDDGTNVGIGTASPSIQFQVINTSTVWAIEGRTTLSSGSLSVGVSGTSRTTGTVTNVGVLGGQGISGNILNIGVWGTARGNNLTNYGGVFTADDAGVCQYNIGVYASAADNCFSPNYSQAGYFQGNAVSTGDFISGFSDIRLKDSVSSIVNALEVIEALKTKEFYFKTDSFPYMNLPKGKHYGLIAQQVDTVLPEIVRQILQPQVRDTAGVLLMDTATFMAVNYNALIPLAIRGIQQLDTLLMQKTSTNISKADSNYVVKWNTTDKTLTKGSIYDRGTHIGIPTVDTTNYVTVANSARQVVLGVSSSNTTATQVVSATYSTNGNANQVAAIKGYSKYTNASSADDGIGGLFEGGSSGVKGTATGAIIAPMGVMGTAQNATYINMGVAGFAESSTSVRNAGVFGSAQNSSLTNYGVLANAHSTSSTSTNTGVNGSAGRSAYQNIGVHAQIIDTTGTNYGLYASVQGNATQHYAGYFNGDVHATGTVTWASDARLKSDIQEVNSTDALALVQRLQPKSYTFNKSSYPYLTLPQGNQYGLLAQDVEQVLPQLVSTITHPETKDAEDNTLSPQFEYKGVNYAGIIPLLVGAVKQQQTHIDSLEAVISNKLTALEERMNNCCTPGSHKRDEGEEEGSINRVQVELSTMQVVVLEQNVPNPFAEQTSISYFIPDGAGQAQVVFSDILGSVIKTVDVEPGYGIMTVFGQSLSKGQYTYSLLIGGKLIETRKMTKTK